MPARAPVIAVAVLAMSLAGCGAIGRKNEPGVAAGESPADLYVDLSAEYLRRGQIDAALERAQRAMAADGKSGRAHYMLALVYQRMGEQQPAEQHFRQAVDLQPKNPEFRNAWGYVLCNQGRYDEALAQIRQAAENPLYQTPEVALMNGADCARRARRDSQAEAFLRDALRRNPAYAPALFAMANRSFERGDYQGARAFLARYSRVGSVTPAALLLAARTERKLGNATEAKALEASLRERFPDAPEVMQL